jgi:hypothetical protein
VFVIDRLIAGVGHLASARSLERRSRRSAHAGADPLDITKFAIISHRESTFRPYSGI